MQAQPHEAAAVALHVVARCALRCVVDVRFAAAVLAATAEVEQLLPPVHEPQVEHWQAGVTVHAVHALSPASGPTRCMPAGAETGIHVAWLTHRQRRRCLQASPHQVQQLQVREHAGVQQLALPRYNFPL